MDIRNVAIIAHVDHGKTTLVDGMIQTAGLFRDNQEVATCVLDSNDLERERGITILSKNISVTYNDVKINVIDTPGHSDFGGEVERVLKMANGVLLLVDAFEGPMPQTRFVLRKALDLNLKPIVVINKIDRPDSRPHEVLDEVFELFLALDANDEQLDFPVIYASGRDGYTRYEYEDGNDDFRPLLDTIVKCVPKPDVDVNGPFQMLVTSVQYSEFTGRVAIGRIFRGSIKRAQKISLVKNEGGHTYTASPKKIMTFEGLGKVEQEEIIAGDIAALEGINNVEIGDSLCDPEHIDPIHAPNVDEPTLSMVFRVNDSPFAGTEGEFVTSRQIRNRLMRELERDVAIRVEDTDRAEVFNVSGRGILHLGILVENMRREGFEFAVGKPQVIMKEINGKKSEPIETLVVDCPDLSCGKVIEEVGKRKGEMVNMVSRQGLTNLEFNIPARGIIGLKTRLLNLTAGEATISHLFKEWEEYKGELPRRANGVIVSSEAGVGVAYALFNLKDRGSFFIKPQTAVYRGMIVGEHSKENDIDVNVCKEKKLSNMRSSGADKKLLLSPPRLFSLEEALEYIESDEFVEVTPKSIRLRKVELVAKTRKR
ncbi:MAG: GTP-binding protein [Planctomycetota bacterium]|jgi:GTP-binding protein